MADESGYTAAMDEGAFAGADDLSARLRNPEIQSPLALEAADALDARKALIAGVLALHQPHPLTDRCAGCWHSGAAAMDVNVWPCETYRALSRVPQGAAEPMPFFGTEPKYVEPRRCICDGGSNFTEAENRARIPFITNDDCLIHGHLHRARRGDVKVIDDQECVYDDACNTWLPLDGNDPETELFEHDAEYHD